MTYTKSQTQALESFETDRKRLQAAAAILAAKAEALEVEAASMDDVIVAGALRSLSALARQEQERVAKRHARVVADQAEFALILESDKARLDRALKALRKKGFVATVSEPSNGSPRETSVVKAENDGAKRVWTYRTRMTDLFDANGNFKKDRWASDNDTVWVEGEDGNLEQVTLVTADEFGPSMKGIYFYHGPDTGSATEAKAVFEEHGFGVKWNGSMADTLFVSTPATVERKVALVERNDALRAMLEEARAPERVNVEENA